jgi:hypothetical protein
VGLAVVVAVPLVGRRRFVDVIPIGVFAVLVPRMASF